MNIASSFSQGSILGPLLFIIYANCFNHCQQFVSSISLADDTNVFIVDNQMQALYERGNREPENIDNWMIAKKYQKQQSNHPRTGKKIDGLWFESVLDRALSTRWFIRTSVTKQDKLPPIATPSVCSKSSPLNEKALP